MAAAATDPQMLKEKLVADSENKQEEANGESNGQPAENGVHEGQEAVSSNGENKRKSTGESAEVEADSTPSKKPRLSGEGAGGVDEPDATKPEAEQAPEGGDSKGADEGKDADNEAQSANAPAEGEGDAPPDPAEAQAQADTAEVAKE